ncbi:MAG TPA: hypothetical protein VLB07_03365 [Woeseiaceae bacterium]|nr:hypothetical protein [Woeseiaceae bacterium]
MDRFLKELLRRNVFRVAGVYAVVGWLLAQAAGVLETSMNMPGWFDTMVVSLLLLGFPIALVLAWAFEVTPEGVKLTAAMPEGESMAPMTIRPIDYLIVGALALVGVLIVADRLLPGKAAQTAAIVATTSVAESAVPEVSDASIAVLPFADLSPEGNQEYFSDGMAEEILNVLAKVDGLTVAARTSSFAFKGRETLGIPAIADELGVRHVLEGSVRKSGDTIRITAQLIDSASNAHLWSEAFDRTLTAENVFSLQDEIAGAIVGALRSELGIEVGDAAPVMVQTQDVDAYELYLGARALFQARRDLTEADRLLAEATEIDPNFADAYAIRAAIHDFGGEYGVQFADERAARAQGRAFAERALALNEQNSLGHAMLALILFGDLTEGRQTGDFDAVFAGLERALALDPRNSNALNWLGIAYGFVGDNESAAASHRRCVEIDPALSPCRSNLAIELVSLGRKDEASAVTDAAIDAGAFGEAVGQLILFTELERRDAFLVMAIGMSALRGVSKFNALYDALVDPREDPLLAAEIRARLIENKASTRTYALLNALGDYKDPPQIVSHWGEVMRGYRRSPEFKTHMRASGVDAYWRKHGFPPQCRPLGADDFECD